jgi:hypothetical protein
METLLNGIIGHKCKIAKLFRRKELCWKNAASIFKLHDVFCKRTNQTEHRELKNCSGQNKKPKRFNFKLNLVLFKFNIFKRKLDLTGKKRTICELEIVKKKSSSLK